MPYISAMHPERCLIGLERPRRGNRGYLRHCATVGHGGLLWWKQDPEFLQTIADNRGGGTDESGIVNGVTDVLCAGCQRRLARMQAEGTWPA